MQQTMMVAEALQAPFLTVTLSYWTRSETVETEVFFVYDFSSLFTKLKASCSVIETGRTRRGLLRLERLQRVDAHIEEPLKLVKRRQLSFSPNECLPRATLRRVKL